MASGVALKSKEDDLEKFWAKYPRAGEPRQVNNKEFSNLGGKPGFAQGPTQGTLFGEKVIFGLTKPRRDLPNGEIVYACRS